MGVQGDGGWSNCQWVSTVVAKIIVFFCVVYTATSGGVASEIVIRLASSI